MLSLFFNGRIIASAEAYNEVYEWMVVEGQGTIRAIGVGDWPRARFTHTHDLKGFTVIPGLNDAHLHCLKLGKSLFSLKCSEAKSIEELQKRLATYVSSSATQHAAVGQANGWVFGYGWEQDKLGRYPTRHDLDKVVSDRPVVLFRVCEHICVVNTAGLRVMNLTSTSPDPEGGRIDRESSGNSSNGGSGKSRKEGKYGAPNGILRETATEFVRVFLKDDSKKKKEYILASLQYCLSNGITAVQTNDTSCWQEYHDLAQQNLLPIRVFLTIDYSDFQKLPKKSPAVFPRSEMLACRRVKLFTDGSLGAETAALSLPYHSSSSSSSLLEQFHSHSHKEDKGVLIMPQPELDYAVGAIHRAGFQLEIHTIGDRSAQAVLRALELNKVQGKDRPVLTHCQVLNADLVKEMGERAVVANIQPQFVTTDSQWVGDRLHPSLLRYSYAWKTLAEAGVHLAGSSDAPVEDPNPFKGMHAAVYRYEANSARAWRPEEALTKQEALRLYTVGSAYGCGREDTLGKLKPGYSCDFVVVDTKLWNSPNFDTCHPQEVWVAGLQRFSRHAKPKL